MPDSLLRGTDPVTIAENVRILMAQGLSELEALRRATALARETVEAAAGEVDALADAAEAKARNRLRGGTSTTPR